MEISKIKGKFLIREVSPTASAQVKSLDQRVNALWKKRDDITVDEMNTAIVRVGRQYQKLNKPMSKKMESLIFRFKFPITAELEKRSGTFLNSLLRR
jgi:hypothetical protein